MAMALEDLPAEAWDLGPRAMAKKSVIKRCFPQQEIVTYLKLPHFQACFQEFQYLFSNSVQ